MKINAKIRNPDKEKNSQLRKNKKIPAIIYGKGLKSIPVSLDFKDFYHLYKKTLGHQQFIFVKLNGKEHRTLIKDIQIDPLTRKVLHIDFQEILSGQRIDINIPVAIIGQAPGIVEGGILDIHLRELTIRCLPKDLTEKLEIDISKMNIGDSIHIKDFIEKYPDIEFLQASTTTIASIVLPEMEVVEKEEEVEEAEEEEEVEEAAPEKEKEKETTKEKESEE